MIWAIVPAAGRGSRYGGAIPKQYLDIAGLPLIAYSLRAVLAHPSVGGAMVVLAQDDALWPGWTEVEGKPVRTCIGGDARADSVLAGLSALPDDVRPDDFVLVHDAARPHLRASDLERLLDLGRGDPVGAILATPVRDTLKLAGDDGGIDGTQSRDRLWRALTPQLFRRFQLTRALEAARDAGIAVTDEAMAMERQGHRPLLVEGSDDNLKVTTPADLPLAEFLLRLSREVSMPERRP
ncbi:2-C-methyl-D-erythritol 4-phosphate cytidylyltransferase [Lysobacter helvus]|uniref:2-C-methyl-D-erythritol 4-phosphate cytidylyltransferase n=2 Tax=Lysobacteraceae TaxID=32033 RepID=A0ABN6FQV9_9GAMM|nr:MULTISPECIES: 2-C-methyl-D-erythritol 4-phosphate cytidylyltransferase [Lysobacter]BCT91349.1 2-C-methyl-D-erythritol 4-phosphate cytidylyltransferase [Lysobacter caseinilyticus]BCT94502.1 2-C-methyl-D-erythritol 4-phosphate cytidylyltransferase [Lysobacter helvus]